jgi:hypothetical protein
MTRIIAILATVGLGAMLAAGSATARGGGHGGGGGGGHAASGIDSGHGPSTGRRRGDNSYSDPYSCESHPSNGSKYLGTDGILPYGILPDCP